MKKLEVIERYINSLGKRGGKVHDPKDWKVIEAIKLEQKANPTYISEKYGLMGEPDANVGFQKTFKPDATKHVQLQGHNGIPVSPGFYFEESREMQEVTNPFQLQLVIIIIPHKSTFYSIKITMKEL